MLEENQKFGQTPGESSKSDMGSTPINLVPSHVLITTMKFDGSNYLTWSKSIPIYVQGKDKEEYFLVRLNFLPRVIVDIISGIQEMPWLRAGC